MGLKKSAKKALKDLEKENVIWEWHYDSDNKWFSVVISTGILVYFTADEVIAFRMGYLSKGMEFPKLISFFKEPD